jgi:NADH dehydrogenase
VLVEAQDRIMREIPESLAEVAARELRRRGLELRTGTTLESMDEQSAVLSTGERLPTRLVCWTAGVRTPGVVTQLGLPLTKGARIETDATMRVKGWDNVWAIGDAAAVPDPARRRREPAPQTCQHAIREGRVVGSNVAAALSGRKPRPLRYRTLGVFVDMGRNKAVATVLGLRLRGFPAWFAARTYHLAMMPGMGRRVRLGIDWAVGLVFGRASAELGQLGHPPSLGTYLDQAAQPGEAPGDRAGDS